MPRRALHPSAFLLAIYWCMVSVLEASNEYITSGAVNMTSNTSLAKEPISCKSKMDFHIGKVGISAVAIVCGLFILVTAYRRRRVSFFLIGALSGGILAYLVCSTEPEVTETVTIIATAACSLAVALFMTLILYCGYFITGLLAGFALSLAAMLLVTAFHAFDSVSLPCVIVIGGCVLQIFVTLWWRRVVLIISSAIVGSSLVIGGLDYFVENFFFLNYIELKVFYSRTYPLCWHNYALLGVWLLLIVGGVVVQLRWTGRVTQDKQYVFIYKTRSAQGRSKRYEEREGLVCAELSHV